mmetsp:Transcript_48802/g.116012  ORF Transcript_48802/g.116012 Transcript_48802/m.116012 type:complete len:660 (-) Transcript_48802:190-2169(-)|eukprot:CAMPEP_0178403718 /NCGR_PEP_ID=MMETSP0689_2-20121128/17514_1 /TAXON_ID=160604 /ORGANISM="Amphidinium massartii, Strain CS-259" /LENGTH=659 /DNA_ID=CAMNT_0020024683 /DNA_START=102 /DNA_END=2081 /DNA_ORIENTATION=+
MVSIRVRTLIYSFIILHFVQSTPLFGETQTDGACASDEQPKDVSAPTTGQRFNVMLMQVKQALNLRSAKEAAETQQKEKQAPTGIFEQSPFEVMAHAVNPGAEDCVGHFTQWTECSDVCERRHTFIIDTPAHNGGVTCEHADGHVMTEPCTGGACPYEELPPAGTFPSSDKVEHVVHNVASHMQLPFFLCVIMSLAVAEVLHKVPGLKALPESFIVVLVSGLLGLTLRFVSHVDRFETEDVRPVSAATMNLVLLPIIIFQSGWSVPMRHMFVNFGYIVIFAVLGTVISTAAITGMIIGTAKLGLHGVDDLRAAVATAVLMSATDPVATLATFARKKVEPTLNILVFGESIINDAVAIVLFNLVNADEPTSLFSREWHTLAGHTVVQLLLGSMVFGFVVAISMVLLYRALHHFGHLSSSFKFIFIISSAYLTNAVAESLHHSGIIACLFSGITMSIYLRPHVGEEDYKRAGDHLQLLAEFADLAVFIMVGVTTALLKSPNGLKFGCYLFVFAIVGRAISVFPCSGLSNAIRMCLREPALCSLKTTTMMWHAGLRGGIALTLVMQLNDWAEQKTVLVTATFLVISLLLVVMGGSTDFMLNFLGIETGVEEPAVKYEDLHNAAQAIEESDSLTWKTAKYTHQCLHKVLVGDSALGKGDFADH